MSSADQHVPDDHISRRRVVYTLPAAGNVTVRQDVVVPTSDGGEMMIDLYCPPDAKPGALVPAVVIVAGSRDEGVRRILGCRFKDMGSSVSWGRLIAASGVAAITYVNREPVSSLDMLMHQLRTEGRSLGIDAERIGVWAASGNAPLALSLLRRAAGAWPRCVVLCYGFTLDLEDATVVADAAKQWGFVNPLAGRTLDDLVPDIPIFLARAGQDQFPGLNATMDRFIARALAGNLPLTVVNHASGPHAFDLYHDSDESRDVIQQILAFLPRHLLAAA